MADVQILKQKVETRFATQMQTCVVAVDQLTIEVAPEHLRDVCQALRDEQDFHYDTLLDVCGVDYLDYGVTEWITDRATLTGFERGVDNTRQQRPIPWTNPRFAVVYHLLSVTHNHRLRLRTFVEGEPPIVNSVTDIWPSANWYEREAFDLYGIVFEGHPDLRRILTDYGFIGHPFRKDFPLSGNVEVRYDAALGRVIYEPVQIVPRVLVPKVIRFDNRYESSEEKKNG